MSVATSTLDRLVQQSGELYSLPAVAVEVLQLASDPQTSARQLKDCIERDPALTTKILRVVNSSLFGLSKQVHDLNQALALLGLKPLKLLVLGFSLPDALFSEVAGDVLTRYWQRTLVKAVAAREICERSGAKHSDEAFIAGLLQDLGLLALVQQVGPAYVQFLDRVWQEQGNLRQFERLALGFDHIQLSARLLEHWRLPTSLVEAAEGRDGALGESTPLSRVLDLAELVTALLCDGRTLALPELLKEPANRSLTRSWLDQLIATLEEKVKQLADVLSLELPRGLNYREVLDRARQQMASMANEVVADLLRERAGAPLDAPQWIDNDARALSAALEAAFAQPATQRRPQPVASAPIAAEDDQLLLAGLCEQVAACRQMRTALSLLLVEADRFAEVIFREGLESATAWIDWLRGACERIDHEGLVCLQTREARLAVMLPDCDRAQAARLGNELLRAVRATETSLGDGEGPAFTVSIGAASVTLPPKNFPAEDLVQAADRCLYGARASGGDVLKSIEII
jgi:HD-like signal output (HDOD) protein/GGDEF domain-containing protein